MTREEAIQVLKNTAWLGSNEDREATEEAIDMAIEALSREQKKYDAICDELFELKSDLMLPIEVAMAVVMKYAERSGSK